MIRLGRILSFLKTTNFCRDKFGWIHKWYHPLPNPPSLWKIPAVRSYSTMGDSSIDLTAAEIFEILTGFQRSQILFAASELGVFDALAGDGEQKKTATQLATELSTDVDAMERLLNSCVSLHLLSKSLDPDKKGQYSNTEASSKYLTAGSKSSMRGYIHFAKLYNYPLMGNLDHAVREGKNQHVRTFGATSSELYENFYADEDGVMTVVNGMQGLAPLASKAVVTAFDLSTFKTACDFGGGSGALAYEMSRTYPSISIKVLELPPVVKVSNHFKPDDAGKLNVEFLAGDFFVDELPEADLYVFSMIFHNWQDDKIIRLLQKVHSTLKPGGAILIAECIYNDDKTGPVDPAQRCMLMLAVTDGKERSGIIRQVEEGLLAVRMEYMDICPHIILGRI
ncbi:acetylserotonin O-methyltransferase-like isoform X2 [Ptychodera flava]|uniref:acetylserotonin O-methyltransferase-like isoform X2 n=1 Tax=Ptychodera flava TaxID=63121 RepID=UPI00396A7EB8